MLVSAMITRIRSLANMEYSQFVTDAELLTYIEGSYGDVYNILISAGANFYINSIDLSIVAGTDTYTLPLDFYKLLGIDAPYNDYYISLKPFFIKERNNLGIRANQLRDLRYALKGKMTVNNVSYNAINFRPMPACSGTLTLWYAPHPISVSATTTDIPIDVVGTDDYLIFNVVSQVLAKEESDNTYFVRQTASALSQIQASVIPRDEGEVYSVVNVNNNYDYDIITEF